MGHYHEEHMIAARTQQEAIGKAMQQIQYERGIGWSLSDVLGAEIVAYTPPINPMEIEEVANYVDTFGRRRRHTWTTIVSVPDYHAPSQEWQPLWLLTLDLHY